MHKTGGVALGMGGVMAAICNCGNPKPLMVPFSTDGGAPIECPQCRTRFVVARIDYDINHPNQMKLGIGWTGPTVQPATLDDIKQLSRGKPS